MFPNHTSKPLTENDRMGAANHVLGYKSTRPHTMLQDSTTPLELVWADMVDQHLLQFKRKPKAPNSGKSAVEFIKQYGSDVYTRGYKNKVWISFK
jgi:hypothetical protein